MHLDENSKKVLRYFIETESPQDKYTIACNVKFYKIDEDKLVDTADKCLDILQECECIKINKATFGNEITYKLTNLGRHYFKISKENTFYKYWYPIITASIAFVLNLIVNLIINLLKK